MNFGLMQALFDHNPIIQSLFRHILKPGEAGAVKIMISAKEAMDKGIWNEILILFGRDADEEFWPQEEFIITEEQAIRLKLIKK
jgi:hypothetical protein